MNQGPTSIRLNDHRREWIMEAEHEWDGQPAMHGEIHEWWSRPDKLPAHWILCDGEDDTPDLRRYVMIDGKASYDYDLAFEASPFAPANYIEYRGPVGEKQAIAKRAERMLAMGKVSELT